MDLVRTRNKGSARAQNVNDRAESPRMRFLTAIQGGSPDALALSIWNNKLPGDELDRQILDLGVCVVVKSSVWRMEYEGVKVEHQDMPYGAGRIRSAITYQTKYGTLREVKVIEPGTSWVREFVFKSPEDYRALETIITARCYEPDFLRFRKDDERYGDGSIARPATIHSPFQELIYEFMGMEAFSMEYLVNPGRLSDLELVLAEDWSKRLEMVQRSPARYSVIEGNTDARMVGPDMFLNHYHPYIQEACKRVHSKGILAGAHLDSDNRQLANQFNQTDIDLVESLTPPPDCPMSVSEARKAWPGKAIQVHFPSSVHLYDGERMKAFCKSLLDDLGMKQGVVVGISEDLPGKGINTLVPMFRNLREFEHRLH